MRWQLGGSQYRLRLSAGQQTWFSSCNFGCLTSGPQAIKCLSPVIQLLRSKSVLPAILVRYTRVTDIESKIFRRSCASSHRSGPATRQTELRSPHAQPFASLLSRLAVTEASHTMGCVVQQMLAFPAIVKISKSTSSASLHDFRGLR